MELDGLVTRHASDGGCARHTAEWDGADKEMLPFVTNTFHMVNEWRPIQDAVASWVCHGALLRFPELRIAVIENGASWLPGLLQNLADTFKKAPEGFGMKDPVEAVKNSIHVSPFWEEDFSKLTALIGAERVLFGSDYPHPEGLAEPTTYIQHIQHLPFEDQKLVMGGNLARLLKV